MNRTISAECVDPELPPRPRAAISRSREKENTRGAKKRTRKGGGKWRALERNREHERTPMNTAHEASTTDEGTAEGSRWHLTLSESGHVHCSPLILVLAVALSNASIGGSRRFECSLYFPFRLPSPPCAPFRFHRDAMRKKASQRDRKDLAVQVESFVSRKTLRCNLHARRIAFNYGDV